MWKASAGSGMNIKDMQSEDDDWETDPDFVNDVTEEEQRWGSKTIEGSGRSAGAIDMDKLRKETEDSDAEKKKKRILEGADNPAYGYGGKFGVQTDRMDSSAMGHDYAPKLEKHVSQKDYSTGFGGKYGVQTDRVDKSALSWDHKEQVEKHVSQKDYSTGFGGKFGVQTDRQDRSAVGWDHVEKVVKHESQKDYSVGFGGKFGVQSDRQDKSAVGWDHHEAPQMHESQTDHKKGFGGKFGVQTDRMDKSAVTFGEQPNAVGTNYSKVKPDIGGAKPSDLRAKWEKMGQDKPAKPDEAAVPSPKKMMHERAAMFSNKPAEIAPVPFSPERNAPKQKLDQSKMQMFNQQSNQSAQETVAAASPTKETKPLDESKRAMFSNMQQETQPVKETNQVKQELEELKQLREKQMQEQQQHTEPQPEPEPESELYDQVEYGNVQVTSKLETPQQQQQVEAVPAAVPSAAVAPAAVAEVKQPVANAKVEDEAQAQEAVEEAVLEDTGYTAIALYDYQAAADDEVSFDPDDVITHVEMIDEGWWRGLCKGHYGLFPANYVQLQQ